MTHGQKSNFENQGIDNPMEKVPTPKLQFKHIDK